LLRTEGREKGGGERKKKEKGRGKKNCEEKEGGKKKHKAMKELKIYHI
jgi:hypothetical protein